MTFQSSLHRGWRVTLATSVTLLLLLALGAVGQRAEAVQPYPNSRNADEALRWLGRNGNDACREVNSSSDGSCKNFVRCVLIKASGGRAHTGGGYYASYQRAGGVLVNAAEAQRGDVIQLTHPSNREAYYTGMHTAIFLGRVSGNNFDVVDSNYGWDWIVKRHHWDPFAWAARHGLTVQIWRMGQTDGSAPRPQPQPQPQPQSPGVVYRVWTDTATLRGGPGSNHANLGTIYKGTAVEIVCQARGTNYGGSTMWSRLRDGRWVHDYLLDSPNYNTLSPPNRWC